jgi:hypothetical protein
VGHLSREFAANASSEIVSSLFHDQNDLKPNGQLFDTEIARFRSCSSVVLDMFCIAGMIVKMLLILLTRGVAYDARVGCLGSM